MGGDVSAACIIIIEPIEKSIPYDKLAKCGPILWQNSADHHGHHMHRCRDCQHGLIAWKLTIARQLLTKFVKIVSPYVIFTVFQNSVLIENSPFSSYFCWHRNCFQLAELDIE